MGIVSSESLALQHPKTCYDFWQQPASVQFANMSSEMTSLQWNWLPGIEAKAIPVSSKKEKKRKKRKKEKTLLFAGILKRLMWAAAPRHEVNLLK